MSGKIGAKPFCVVTKSGKVVSQEVLSSYITEQSKQIKPDEFINEYGAQGLLIPRYSPYTLARLLELNTYHARACKTKARDTAGLGWEFKQTSQDADDTQKEPFQELFGNINPGLSQIFNNIMLDYEAIGYGTLEIIRRAYKYDAPIVGLSHVNASTVRIHKSLSKYCQIRHNKKRWFKAFGYKKDDGTDVDININTGEEAVAGTLSAEDTATEMQLFVNYNTLSETYGAPDIIPALGAVYGDISRTSYNIDFFSNYGVPSHAVFITGNFDPGELDEDGRSELENTIQEHFSELAQNPHSTLVLTLPTSGPGDNNQINVEFKPLSVEQKEASFRLYRVDNRDEILASHGVPPYRMGIAETGSLGGSTASESTKIYKVSVVEPRQDIIERFINSALVKPMGITDWQFKFIDFDVEDIKAELEIAKGIFDMGGITPNQIIAHFGAKFGLSKIDNKAMDAHYINSQPIDISIDEALLDKHEDTKSRNWVTKFIYKLEELIGKSNLK